MAEAAGGGACQSNSSDDAAVLLLMCVCCFPPFFLQAINGGNATWFGVNVPFDLNTLLAVVSKAAAAALTGQYACNQQQQYVAASSSILATAAAEWQPSEISGSVTCICCLVTSWLHTACVTVPASSDGSGCLQDNQQRSCHLMIHRY